MKVKRKLKNRAAFSLGEMLVTVIILLLVSTIVATGVPAARNAYVKVVVGANAKTLLSTTIAALRDELTTARDVVVGDDGKTVTYYSANDGAESSIYLAGDVIMLAEYKDINPMPGIADPLHQAVTRALVSRKAMTKDLNVCYNSVEKAPDGGTITFGNLAVYWGTEELASVDNLTIRFIIPSPTPAAA